MSQELQWQLRPVLDRKRSKNIITINEGNKVVDKDTGILELDSIVPGEIKQSY